MRTLKMATMAAGGAVVAAIALAAACTPDDATNVFVEKVVRGDNAVNHAVKYGLALYCRAPDVARRAARERYDGVVTVDCAAVPADWGG